MDDPSVIIKGALENHYKMVKQFKGKFSLCCWQKKNSLEIVTKFLNYIFLIILYTSFSKAGNLGIFLFNVYNGSTRRICQICFKLTTKTRERYWRRSHTLIVNFEQILCIIQVFPSCFLWTSKWPPES